MGFCTYTIRGLILPKKIAKLFLCGSLWRMDKRTTKNVPSGLGFDEAIRRALTIKPEKQPAKKKASAKPKK